MPRDAVRDRARRASSSASRCSTHDRPRVGGSLDARPGDRAPCAEQQRRDERARARRARPSCSNTTTQSAHAEAVGAQREHAGLGELVEHRAVEAGADAVASAKRPSSSDAMPSRSATWSSERSRSIERGSRGQAEHALADDVALDLRRARRDRERERAQPLLDELVAVDVAARRGRARAGTARRSAGAPRSTRASSPSRPARTRRRAACETLRFVSAHSASNSAAHVPELAAVRRDRRTSGARSSHEAHRVDELAHERGAALVLQRDVRDAPAVVLGADAVRDRHAHVGEEHLGRTPRCRARS